MKLLVHLKGAILVSCLCSAKRTAVIDDQSDYFEVDTNNWLSEKVRLGFSFNP
jgi:hypothetical protein